MISYNKYIKEIKKNITRVVDNKNFILGPEVCGFEKEVAQYIGVKYAIGVNSCTDALIYSLKSLGIGNGDEVICPVFTFVGTAEAIVWAGAKPVFSDVEPETFNIDINHIEKLITSKTKAIIPVHIYGQPANMKEIKKIAKKHKLKIIEDNAQAFGGKYFGKKTGSFGDMGCLSFFPSKILGAFGDGGMVLTNNLKLAKNIKMMRIDGATDVKKIYREHKIIGGSSRLHEIQASVLRTKFKYLKDNLDNRQKIANFYNNKLKDLGDLVLPIVLKNNYHVYNSYVIKTDFRDKLKLFLAKKGVETKIIYPKPLHILESFRFLNYKSDDFPMAKKVSNQVLALPIDEFLSIKKVKNITNLIKEFFTKI